ncbi:NAD-dependent epimerase/dehydratase family protein, partial [Streptococcus suis]
IDFIIHGASVTASRDFVEKPVDTIFTALNGTKNILELAKVKKVKKVVYLSSLEVYGINELKESISEDDYGYIDFTQVRSSYSEGKRMAECL